MSEHKVESLTPEELEALGSVNLDELDAVSGAAALPELVQAAANAPPGPSDEAWQAYVISLLRPGEKDKDNLPRCHGLRRLVQLLLGPIIRSRPRTIQVPAYSGATEEKLCVVQPAVVEWDLAIKSIRPETEGLVLEFGDVAEGNQFNLNPGFAKFAAPTTATRAESRAYRKALGLSKIAAEEKGEGVPVPLEENGGFATETQISILELFCGKQLNLNLMRVVNEEDVLAGKEPRYQTINRLPEDEAAVIIQRLHRYRNNPKLIPELLKGYKSDWRK